MENSRFRNASIALAVPVALLLVLIVLLAQPAEAANPSMTIYQCAMGQRVNGSYEDPACEGQGSRGWVTGKVGANNASYWLGDFIAYRVVFENLDLTKRYCVAINWDVAKASLPAIDYIGTYSITLPQANPLWGTDLQGLGLTPQKYPLAVDPILDGNNFFLNVPGSGLTDGIFTGTLPFSGTSAPQGHWTVWGAQDPKGKGLFIQTPDQLTDPGNLTDQSQGAELCFTPNHASGTTVMAWGGNIAWPKDWQKLDRPTGSPYHSRTGSPTIDGVPMFTDPRNGVNDMAEFVCTDLATCDDTPAADATHYTVGNQDLQLGINQEPTNIALRTVSANDNGDNLVIGLIGVAILGLVTGFILLLRKRDLNEV